MAKSKASKRNNIIFLVIVVLLLIPQTRLPIQVFFNRLMTYVVVPKPIDKADQMTLTDYQWILKDSSGKRFDFNTAKGKVIVINFWATWCPPCVAEMPSLQTLYNRFSNTDDVVFLFVSNENTEVIKNFMDKNTYTFKVFESVTNYPEVFNVSSIPRTLVINREGAIIIDKTGAADWSSASVVEVIENEIKGF